MPLISPLMIWQIRLIKTKAKSVCLYDVRQEADRDKRTKKSTAGRGSKDQQGSRKRSQSHSSSSSRSSSSSSSSSNDSSTSNRSRDRGSRSLHRHRRRSRSGSGSRGRRPQGRQQRDDHSEDHRDNGRRGSDRGSRTGSGREYSAKKEETRLKETKSSNPTAVSKTDAAASLPQTMASADAEKKVENATSSSAQPMPNNSGPATGPQTDKPQSFNTAAINLAAGMKKPVPRLMELKFAQPAASSSEPSTGSTFSRDSIVRNLQEMVKPAAAVSVPEGSRSAEDVPVPAELNEKEKSALEFAISMYMAANEFYDGGSLWCRQCDNIFTDISALCRHVHSDRHQLVSSSLLPDNVQSSLLLLVKFQPGIVKNSAVRYYYK